ncbi:hypothetical protein BTVI_14385 [Pitangus sulphuratus]|nr:hypothetical protein BTVI_14385 [Pitangus sulphuratus]
MERGKMAELESLETAAEHERILREIESTDTACIGPTLSFLPEVLRETFRGHGIMEWFELEGNLKLISFQPPAMGRETFTIPGCSNLALDTFRDPGAATASLPNLCQGLPTLPVKNFFQNVLMLDS